MRRSLVGALAIVVGVLAWSVTGQAGQGGPANAPANPVAQAEPGIISGVVLDSNTKQPIAGAIVNLQPSRGGGSGVARGQATDARGRFILTGLPASTSYAVSAMKPGYVTPTAATRQLSVLAGQWIQDVKLELSRNGSIGGTVVDERGEPIVGARVRVLAQLTIAGRMNLVSGVAVKTDDRGAYRIPGLPQGRYIMSVPSVQNAVPADTSALVIAGRPPAPVGRGAGAPVPELPAIDLASGQRLIVGNYLTLPPADAAGRTQAYPIAFYPSVTGIAEASVIALGPGENRDGIDFQLRPVRTWSVAGRTDGPLPVVAGLLLRLMPIGMEDLGMGSEAATTLVMSDGRFVFPNVPAGRYTLDARPTLTEYTYRPQGTVSSADALPRTPGFVSSGGGGGTITGAPQGTQYGYSAVDRDATMWGRADVDVANRDVTDLVVTMRRAVRLSGRFVIERTQADPAPTPSPQPVVPAGRGGAPPGGLRPIIMAEPADGSASLGILRGQVAADDTFTVDGLLPGRYVLNFLLFGGGGGAPLTLKSIMAGEVDHTYVPFDAAAGSDFSNVVVTFTDKAQSVGGTVTNLPSGQTSAMVLVFPADRARWTNFGFQPRAFRSIPVGARGEFEVSVQAGDYLVAAVDSARAQDWQHSAFLDLASRNATRVSVDWGEAKKLTLRFTELPQ